MDASSPCFSAAQECLAEDHEATEKYWETLVIPVPTQLALKIF